MPRCYGLSFRLVLLGGILSGLSCGSSSPTAPSPTSTPVSSSSLAVTSLAVNPSEVSLGVGNTVTLTATASYSNGTTGNVSATWGSTDSSVASISTTGVATARAVGTALITATSGGQSGSASVTVVESAGVTSISVSASATSLTVGATAAVTATAVYSDGTTAEVTPTWGSSNPSIATVSPSGTVAAVAVGTTTITATFGGQVGLITISVSEAGSSPTVTLDTPTPLSPANGGNVATLKPQFVVTNGAVSDNAGSVLYEFNLDDTADVSSPAAFSVSRSTGETTTTQFGDPLGSSAQYWWRVRATNGTDASDWSAVQSFWTLSSLEVSAGNASLAVHETTTVIAKAVYPDGSKEEVVAVWTSSNTGVASVTSDGSVTALASGTTAITATFGEVSGSLTVTVISDALEYLSVSAANDDTNLVVGETTTMSAEAVYADESREEVAPAAVWSTSNAGVASIITADGTVTVTALAAGTTVITGTYQDKTGSVSLTVSAAVSLSDLEVSANDTSLRVGETTQVTARAKYSDGSKDQVTPTWSSSNTGVASVTSGGTVTARAVGTAVITGTYQGKSDSVSITVSAVETNHWTVIGWVGAWLRGGWVDNAEVRIGNSASATTDADGRFELELTQSGTLPVVVEASGFHRSEAEISVQSQTTYAQRNIVPTDTSRFDLNFYDHVFRDKGTRGTYRWASRPAVEIWTTKFVCLDYGGSDDKYCDRYEATGESAPSSHESNVRSVFANDVSGITAGELSVLSIQTRSHASGTIVSRDVCNQPRDTIIAVYIDMDLNGAQAYAPWCAYTSGEIKSTEIHMKPGSPMRSYRHEIAHNLGWGHPDGGDNVPGNSIIRYGVSTMTQADKNHGTILYTRPPGSLTPDKDPSGTTINLFTLRGLMPRPGSGPSGWGPSVQQSRPRLRGPLVSGVAP